MTPTREFWDERYADAHYLYGTRPNAFLVAQATRLPPAADVLLVGDGEGRNGVWLAERGHHVTSVDYSAEAVGKARRLARDRGVATRALHADLLDWEWPTARVDAVAAIYLHLEPDHRRRVHARLLEALRPGGLVILEAFTPEQLRYASGGPRSAELLYDAELLRADFSAADILLLEERHTVLDEGPGHRGEAAVVRLVAQRR